MSLLIFVFAHCLWEVTYFILFYYTISEINSSFQFINAKSENIKNNIFKKLLKADYENFKNFPIKS